MTRTRKSVRMSSGTQRATRIGGLAGLLGVASGVLGGAIIAPIWSFPGSASTIAHVASFPREHRTALLIGMFFNTAAVLLWLAFGAALWSYLRRLGHDDFGHRCFALGIVSMVTLLLAGFTAFFVLVYRSGSATEVRTLYDLTFALLAMSAAPTVLALGAFAALVRRSRCLPRSTAALALVAAVAHVALFASFVPRSGFFSLEGQVIVAIPATLFAWIAVTAAAMLSVDRRVTQDEGRLSRAV